MNTLHSSWTLTVQAHSFRKDAKGSTHGSQHFIYAMFKFHPLKPRWTNYKCEPASTWMQKNNFAVFHKRDLSICCRSPLKWHSQQIESSRYRLPRYCLFLSRTARRASLAEVKVTHPSPLGRPIRSTPMWRVSGRISYPVKNSKISCLLALKGSPRILTVLPSVWTLGLTGGCVKCKDCMLLVIWLIGLGT